MSVGIQIVQLLYDDQEKPIDYLFLDVNSIYAKFIGFAKVEIVGEKATDLIALSGYAQNEDIERSKESGFNKHLGKPVSIETIQMVLNEIK